jgi:hypothetical protein
MHALRPRSGRAIQMQCHGDGYVLTRSPGDYVTSTDALFTVLAFLETEVRRLGDYVLSGQRFGNAEPNGMVMVTRPL